MTGFLTCYFLIHAVFSLIIIVCATTCSPSAEFNLKLYKHLRYCIPDPRGGYIKKQKNKVKPCLWRKKNKSYFSKERI